MAKITEFVSCMSASSKWKIMGNGNWGQKKAEWLTKEFTL